MIPEEYGGLGESLLTYALAVEEIARGWMSVSAASSTPTSSSPTCCCSTAPRSRSRSTCPRMATGEVRGAFSMSEPGCGSDVAAIKTKAPGPTVTGGLRDHRPEDVADQRRLGQPGRRAGEDRRGRRLRLPEHDDVPGREGGRLRRDAPRASPSPARSRRWATRASTPPSWSSRATGSPPTRSSAASPGKGFYQMMDGVEVGRVNVAARGCGVANRARSSSASRLRPAARDVRQEDRRAPGGAVPARRDGHQGRGRPPDDGQGRPHQGHRRAQRPRGRDGEVPRQRVLLDRSSRTPSGSTAATASPRSTRSSGSTARRRCC